MNNVVNDQQVYRDLLICSAGQYNLSLDQYSDIDVPLKRILLRRALANNAKRSKNYVESLIGVPQYEQMLARVNERNKDLLTHIDKFGVDTRLYADYIPQSIENTQVSKSDRQISGIVRFLIYVSNQSILTNKSPQNGNTSNRVTDFIEKCLYATNGLHIKNLLWRLHGGGEADRVIELMQNTGDKFIIRRNLYRKSPEQWLELARHSGSKIFSRPWKNIYIGVTAPMCCKYPAPVFLVYKVIERLVDAKTGAPLNYPGIEVETWYSNLNEKVATIIELFHASKDGKRTSRKNDLNEIGQEFFLR